MRLTLRDQSLALHKSEFPSIAKTYAKLCQVMRKRFDSTNKRKYNTKAILGLSFGKFFSDSECSQLKVFNRLVLRIEKLAAVAA